MSSGALITDGVPKKAKRVTGEKKQMKALKDLQDVNKAIEKRQKTLDQRFEVSSKLFDKRRKLQEQLGI
jgi:hypothetical protein